MRTGIALFLGLCTAVTAYGELRTWTSRDGKTIEAEYVRDAMDHVWIKGADGKTRKVPIYALSDEDQDYIYSQTLPSVEINLDQNTARSTDGTDIDNVVTKLQVEFDIAKTSRRPYPGELTVYYYLIGWALDHEQYWVIESHKDTFTLTDKGMTSYEYQGDKIRLVYDPDPGWGNDLKGALVWVETGDGEIIECEGRGLYKKHIPIFKGAKYNARFDKNWEPTKKARSVY